MTSEQINDATAYAEGELFDGEADVRGYFRVANMAAMFEPGDPGLALTEAQLASMADEVIENRWHMVSLPYTVTHEGHNAVEYHADTAEDAAQEYHDGCYWEPQDRTLAFTYTVHQDGELCERVTILLHPDEPDCTNLWGHRWADSGRGVWGTHGVASAERCAHCGLVCTEDSKGTVDETGERYESVAYTDGGE